MSAIDDLPLFIVHAEMSALERAFWSYHERNPKVYDLLVRMARSWVKHTKRKIGVKALFERARWEMVIDRFDDDGFKLCNSHTAFYARLIMQREPDLAGVFELRKQKQASTILA